MCCVLLIVPSLATELGRKEMTPGPHPRTWRDAFKPTQHRMRTPHLCEIHDTRSVHRTRHPRCPTQRVPFPRSICAAPRPRSAAPKANTPCSSRASPKRKPNWRRSRTCRPSVQVWRTKCRCWPRSCLRSRVAQKVRFSTPRASAQVGYAWHNTRD